MNRIEKQLRKSMDKDNAELGNWFKAVTDRIQQIAYEHGWQFRISTEFAGRLQQDLYTTGLLFTRQNRFTYTQMYLKNADGWRHTDLIGAFFADGRSGAFQIPYVPGLRSLNATQFALSSLEEHELEFMMYVERAKE